MGASPLEYSSGPMLVDSSPLSIGPASDDEAPRATVEPERAPSDNDRYQVVAELGRGGMGCVMRAVDRQMRREVAIKEIIPAYLNSAEHIARFLREARITGRLDHPSIVPVYEIGRSAADAESNGRVFYTMKLVRGRTLKQALSDFHESGRTPDAQAFRSPEGQRLLDAFVAACNAVAFAHSRGVIHRDLKPDNIMLGDFGETILLDWGLAKVVGEDNDIDDVPKVPPGADPTDYGHTEFGAVMGTPQYLSPEQAAGRKDLLDGQTDVYSLGVALYQVLTGELPFGQAKPQEVLMLVQQQTPQSPRLRKRGVPAALSAVCMKAIDPDRNHRYAGAAELAADIRRWIADQPVSAFPESIWQKATRWVRHHRALASSATVVLVLNLVRFGWVGIEDWLDNRRQSSAARESVQRAGDTGSAAWQDTGWARYRRGLLRLRADAPAEAVEDLQRAVELEPENPLPRMALAAALARSGRAEEAKMVAVDCGERLKLARERGLFPSELLRGDDAFLAAQREPSLREATDAWLAAPSP